MNQRQRFIRKIVYACAIAALLLPLSWLSQPETTAGSEGGLLARMRKEHHLSQAALGEIDPASETIKLVTLGMRGVAANILWEKANHYRKVEDWSSLSATYEQIARLQPNFVTVWVFQSWNLSYNISVEFDDYHDRYYWVIKGIDFLKEGTTYNTEEPRLLSEIGWILSQKIGRADEHVQFRRLFREDDDFNGSRPLAQRDNWLVGREWQLQAQRLVDEKGITVRGKTPLLFYSQSPMCLINYSEALEEEGTFGEVAKSAWRKAADAWNQYSNRDLPTQYNFSVRLSEKEIYEKRSREAQDELTRLAPAGLREEMVSERLAALTPQERDAYDTPDAQRTSEQRGLVPVLDGKMKIEHVQFADRIKGENHAAALKAAEEATQCDFIARAIDNQREIVNYDYWLLRCQLEPNDDTLAARKLIYDADKAFVAANIRAPELYVEGFKNWRKVLDAHPALIKDSNFTDELADSVEHYRNALHQIDETLPKPFILQDVLDADEAYHGALGRKPRFETSQPGPGEADPTDPGPPGAVKQP